MNEEITLTVASNTNTESLAVSKSTSISDLCDYTIALLGLDLDVNRQELIFIKDGKLIYSTATTTSSNNSNSDTISTLGIQNGDFLLAEVRNIKSTGIASTGTSASTSNGNDNNNGLDFSSLLGYESRGSNNNHVNTNNTGLVFTLPGLQSSSNTGSSYNTNNTNNNNNNNTSLNVNNTKPIEWENMNLDQAIASNPNPHLFIQVLLNYSKHPHLIKELNYHNPTLAKQLQNATNHQLATQIWTRYIQKNTIHSTLSKTLTQQKSQIMHQRLRSNPNDVEAQQYIHEQTRLHNVQSQYEQMMEEYPESLGRVLMLYIDLKVNEHPIQAFVDSGAQTTIMSSKCAKACNILQYIDTRFEGTAVGVGTGKILGKVHIVQIQVQNHFFPCSITVMDSESNALGDKNMDFLLGLDMLKRHGCVIDLGRNCLTFRVGHDGMVMETPFLHEKDLPESKGGTKGFDAEQSNLEYYTEHQKLDDEGNNNTKKKSKSDDDTTDEK